VRSFFYYVYQNSQEFSRVQEEPMSLEFLWYIPNQGTPGHRGEPVTADHNSLDILTSQARAVECQPPGKFGGAGAATTWLVGSAQDVAKSLRKYASLGITHFILSDTPYLPEIKRQGDQLLPLLRD
jgi:alkanesulfonate monooxygenase SsuD/methylene tetrahydromethanopterin reductase-like flavin-dependent oxidoreductase (luciferase family)